MRREARDAVNKRGLVQFRADAKLIDRLYAEAGKLGLPVGTMVRMWVMERLNKQQKRGSG
jgi:antitoxin component of RelBE/YafQ-DinJ toxin-antitoxin module